jgi:predicted dehydrogenase
MSPLRIGLVGYGVGGRYFHAPVIDGAGCQLAAVVTTDPRRQREVEQDFPGTRVVEHIQQLADIGIDAVTVTTPVESRDEVLRQAIELGLPIMCDKPFSMSADAGRELLDVADAAGVPVTSYQNRRWDSDFLTIRAVIESGRLGDLVRFESAIEGPTPAGGVTVSGGGMLRDIGSHLVDQILQLIGPVVSVYAAAHEREDLGLDDQFTLELRHANGVTSHLAGSQAAHGEPVTRFRAVGREASYSAPHHDGQADALFAGLTPHGLGTSWGLVPSEFWGAVYRGGEVTAVPSERGDWCELYRLFAESVRSRGIAPVPASDAISVLTVLDAARLSALEDRVVAIS